MQKLYYDLHIHSCLSPCGDNDMTVNNIAGMGKLAGLNIMALTDHNTVKNLPAFFSACEKYDIVLSRAVSRMATLTELCLPLVKVGGKMVALKSRSAKEELDEAQKVIELLGGKAEPIYGTEERNLVIITKVSPTPPIYPRKAGTPEKFPII